MAAKYGTFATTTATAGNTVTVTGVGFLPKFILFWLSGTTSGTDAVTGESHKFGFGVAASPTDRRCIATQSEDAAATSSADHAHRNDACICVLDNTGAVVGLMDHQSMDADGFSLVIDDAFPASYIISFLAVQATNVITGQLQEPGATGNQDTTGLGFIPTGAIFFGVPNGSAPNAIGVDSLTTIGAASSSTQQGVMGGGADDGAITMQTAHIDNLAECIEFMAANLGNPDARATFDSFLSDGFRLNWLERTAAGRYVHYVAFNGVPFHVGSVTSRTDTTPTAETSPGFPPAGLMFLATMGASVTVDSSAAHHQFSVGGANSTTSRGVQLISDRDGVADAEVCDGIEYDEVYINVSTAGAIVALMDIQSFDATGFTFVMDDVEATGKPVHYWAFGGIVNGSLSQTLDNATLSSNAVLAISATLSQTLGNVALSSTATLAVTATVTQTLGNVVLSANATLPLIATLAQTLANVTLSATAVSPITGTANNTLENVTVNGVADLLLSGSLDVTLENVTLSSNATLALTGQLNQTLESVSLSSNGTLALTGTLDSTLESVSLSSQAVLPIIGALTQTLADVTLSSTGSTTEGAQGEVNETLENATLSSNATLALSASLTATLEAVVLTANGFAEITAAVNVTLENVTLSSDSDLAIAGSLTQTLADITLVSTGEMAGVVGTLTTTLENVSLSSSSVLALSGSSNVALENATLFSVAAIAITGQTNVTLGNVSSSIIGLAVIITIITAGSIKSSDPSGGIHSSLPIGKVRLRRL